MPSLLSRTELAATLGVAPRTIMRMDAAGRIPSYRIGRLVKYDLAEALAALRTSPADPVERPNVPHPVQPPRSGTPAPRRAATVAELRAQGGGDAA